jgi:hypothetical protein
VLTLCILAVREVITGANTRRRAADTSDVVPSASDLIAAEFDQNVIEEPIAKEQKRRA